MSSSERAPHSLARLAENWNAPRGPATPILSLARFAPGAAIAQSPAPPAPDACEKVAEALRESNAKRHTEALEMRDRIGVIVRDYAALHGGEWPSARQVCRALKPAIDQSAPIKLRAAQLHMKALRAESTAFRVDGNTA